MKFSSWIPIRYFTRICLDIIFMVIYNNFPTAFYKVSSEDKFILSIPDLWFIIKTYSSSTYPVRLVINRIFTNHHQYPGSIKTSIHYQPLSAQPAHKSSVDCTVKTGNRDVRHYQLSTSEILRRLKNQFTGLSYCWFSQILSGIFY